MQYRGIEYQNLYKKGDEIYKTVGSAIDYENSSKSLILFTNISGATPVYYMSEEQFTKDFVKVNKYT